ncbi:MAG: FkbM family methyltransferase [Smithella sp.]
MNIHGLFSSLFHRDSCSTSLQESVIEIECVKSGTDDRLIYDIKLDRELVVVDVGCRWGFAEQFTKDAGHFRVYGFDCDIEECDELNRRYKGSAVTIIPIGLAGKIGKRTLYVTQEPACSSLFKPDAQLTENYPALYCARHISTVDVETTTLDNWSEEYGVHIVDYIKIDTQGTELEILEGGINILRTVRALEIEVEFNPIYSGQPVFSDVDSFLRSEGFVLWKLTNQVHYSKEGSSDEPIGEDIVCYDGRHKERHKIFGGQLYWANAHYIKKSILDVEDSETQKNRDIILFHTLGMLDVVNHIYGSNWKGVK